MTIILANGASYDFTSKLRRLSLESRGSRKTAARTWTRKT